MIDTSGPPLVKALAAGPDLIKPNADELADAVGGSRHHRRRRRRRRPGTAGPRREGRAGQPRRRRRAPGHRGRGRARRRRPSTKVVSTVGAGDALLAGYLSRPPTRRRARSRPGLGRRRRPAPRHALQHRAAPRPRGDQRTRAVGSRALALTRSSLPLAGNNRHHRAGRVPSTVGVDRAYSSGDRRGGARGVDAVAPVAPARRRVGGDRRPDPRCDRADDQGGDPRAGHGRPHAPDRGGRSDDARRFRPPRHQPGLPGRDAPHQPHRAVRRPVGDGLRPARGAQGPDRQARRGRRRRPVRGHRHDRSTTSSPSSRRSASPTRASRSRWNATS